MLDNTMDQSLQKDDQRKEDLYFYTQSWVWRAIEALVLAKDFDPSPRSIANRLNISIEAAVDALDGLERLGSIYRDGRNYARNLNLNLITPENTSKNQILHAHTNITNQMITKLTPDSFYTNQICLGSIKLVKENLYKISDFLNTLDQEGRNEDSPGLISVEFSVSCIENTNNIGANNA